MGSCIVEMDVKSFQPKAEEKILNNRRQWPQWLPEEDGVVEGLLVCLLTACSCRAYQDTWRRWDQRWLHCRRWDGYVGVSTSFCFSVCAVLAACQILHTFPSTFAFIARLLEDWTQRLGLFTSRCLISTALTNPGFFIFFLANIFYTFLTSSSLRL